jgi:hypothetical protein
MRIRSVVVLLARALHRSTIISVNNLVVTCLAITTVLLAASASAQVERRSYVVGAAGAYSNPFTSGGIIGGAGGGELVRARVLGAGGELGFLEGGGDAAITVSVSAITRLSGRRSAARTTPFVAAGYTHLVILTDTGQGNAWHFRAGVDRRIGRHRQLRVEFLEILRHHAWTDYYSFGRIGVTFG